MAEIFGRLDRSPKQNRQRCISVWSMLFCLVVLCATWDDIAAQESTKSHRLLGNGLPTLSGGQSQMELIRRLQMLSGAAQSNGKTPEDSPLVDPEAMRRLQEAMQSLQKLNSQQPENNRPNQQGTPFPGENSSGRNRNLQPPRTNPPERGTNSEPFTPGATPDRTALQRIAEQMGLSLGGPNDRSNNGREPGTDSTTQQPRPNNLQGTRPTPQGGTPGNTPGSETGQRNTGSNPSNSGRPTPSATGNRTPGENSEPTPGRSTNEQTEPPKSSVQALLDWIKNTDQSTRNGNSPSGIPGGTTDGSPGTRMQTPGNNGQTAQPQTGTDRSQGQPGRGRNDRATGRTPRSNEPGSNNPRSNEPGPTEPASPGRSWFPGEEIAPPRSQQPTEQRGNGSTGQGNTGRPGTSGRSPNNVSSTLEGNGGNSSSEESTGNNTEQRSAAQIREERLNAQREERLDEVRSSGKTLRQKLAEIAKLARSESDQSDSAGGDAESQTGDNLQSAFVEALAEATKGLAEQVDGIVRDERFSRRDRGRRSSRRDRDGPFRQFSSLGTRFNDMLTSTAEPDAPPTSVMSDGLSGSPTGGGGVSPGLLAALFIIGGVGFWMLQKKRSDVQLQNAQLSRVPAPSNLKSRQDIVQAFHDLADRCPAVVADWWTHDRAAQALATSRPDVDDEVRQLAQLYEQARYLPEESQLTDEQLAAAKAAWLRCRKS